jgi:tripartite-type tricarboxylate transporter receptor subunit TctC
VKTSSLKVWALLLTGLLASAAQAQNFPAKPVKIIVPFSAGTAADIVARQLGQGLSELWAQPVFIENIQGAGGGVGAAAAAKASPDGYTLLMLGLNHVINPSLYKDVPFDLLRDFKAIGRVASGPLVIIAHPSLPVNTVPELISLAKAQPGKINFGSGGNGSVTHLSLEMLKSRAGINLVHIPYKGISQMMTDVLGNQINLGSPAVASAVANIKSGKLKALAVTSAKRSAVLPDVPTMAESGGALTGYDVSTWSGLLAPTGTPDAVITKIYADMAKVAQSRSFAEQLNPQGLVPDLMGAAEFRVYLVSELSKWSLIVKDSGAKLD